MRISTRQIDDKELVETEFDLIIASSGYESRGSFLFKNFKSIKGDKKLILCFENYREEPNRLYNDKVFENLGFEPHVISGNDKDTLLKLLEKTWNGIGKKEVNILIDYSCMTRVWYAEILKFFHFVSEQRKVVICFSYSVSSYVAPPENGYLNRFVSPIPGFYSISTPARPTSLIIGLGYVSSRAFGLAEYFDVTPYLFINDANFNKKFHYEVLKQNEDLIKNVPPENIYLYPLNNLSFTETLLNHLCHDLLTDYRIILAPCGPKPFTLISLITCLRLKDVDVWRISAGEKEKPIDKPANGTLIILRVTLSN